MKVISYSWSDDQSCSLHLKCTQGELNALLAHVQRMQQAFAPEVSAPAPAVETVKPASTPAPHVAEPEAPPAEEPKKRGRPAGSTNKPKEEAPKAPAPKAEAPKPPAQFAQDFDDDEVSSDDAEGMESTAFIEAAAMNEKVSTLAQFLIDNGGLKMGSAEEIESSKKVVEQWVAKYRSHLHPNLQNEQAPGKTGRAFAVLSLNRH